MTRNNIEATVKAHPGISFNRLKEKTGMANGVIQYHLHRSDRIERRSGAIVPEGYCGSCKLRELCEQNCLMSVLRDPMKQSIVSGLETGKTQQELAEELERDKSTISYHVSRMTEYGVLEDKHPVSAVKQVLEIL